MNLEEMRARQREIADALRQLHEQMTARTAPGSGATDEARAAHDAAVTADEERWDALNTEHDALEGQISRAERAQRVAESRDRWRSVNFGDRPERPQVGDLRTADRRTVQRSALAVLDDDESAGHLSADQRSAAARLIRANGPETRGDAVARMLLATETDDYRGAFARMAAYRSHLLTDDQRRALGAVDELRTALQITNDANGGLAVPTLIDPTIVLTAGGSDNPFFNIARVEQITTDEWRGLTSAGATWYWTTESVASTDGAPTLAQPSVPTKKITGWIPFSVEIEGDWPGFAAQMSRVLRESYDEAVLVALTNGTGVNAQPTGIVTALEANTAVQLVVSTDGALYASDFYRLWKALPQRSRRNATWMMSTGVENAMRQFGTDDPNFTASIGEAGISRLFGRPVIENDYMDDVVTVSTADASLAIVGDFRNFLIAQRVGMTIELVPHVMSNGVPTGQRGYWAWARIGSDSINDDGFRMLTQD